jgi:ATP adenylyltransferase
VKRIYAPWRVTYLMSGQKTDCLFCDLAGASVESDDEHYILERGKLWYVIVNRYPYTTGHMMVVCNRHVENMNDLTEEEGVEFMELMAKTESVLREAYHPDGINVGANLGRSAGAGIVGHLHMHLVPRWHGDTNFMSAIGETRVVSEDIGDTFRRLQGVFRKSRTGTRHRGDEKT